LKSWHVIGLFIETAPASQQEITSIEFCHGDEKTNSLYT